MAAIIKNDFLETYNIIIIYIIIYIIIFETVTETTIIIILL